jgi:hypothetical protein
VAVGSSPGTARHPTLALLVAALLGSLPLWGVAAPAPAAASARCDGVWVVVDAQEAGGAVTTRCAPGDPSSGLAALEGAGHRYTFVRPNMPMVCTIDGRPDPCNGAPGDAYWSYWYAQPGGSWTYASQGAGSRNPAPGSVEGWAFGAGAPPRVPPPSSPPPEPEPSTSPTPSPSASPSPSPTATAEPAPTAPAERSAPPTTPPPGPAAATAPDDPPPGSQATEQPDPAERDEPETPAPDEAHDPAARTTDAARAARPPTPADERPAPTEASGRTLPPVELRAADDEVAIGAPTDGDAVAGLLAGGALAATIAGAGLFQARRRRRSFDP